MRIEPPIGPTRQEGVVYLSFLWVQSIDMNTLRDEVGLKIENLADLSNLHKNIRTYFELLRDYMVRQRLMSFIHSRGFF